MKCQNIFLFVAAIFSIEQVALPLNWMKSNEKSVPISKFFSHRSRFNKYCQNTWRQLSNNMLSSFESWLTDTKKANCLLLSRMYDVTHVCTIHMYIIYFNTILKGYM
jgi:hypothetical protein